MLGAVVCRELQDVVLQNHKRWLATDFVLLFLGFAEPLNIGAENRLDFRLAKSLVVQLS